MLETITIFCTILGTVIALYTYKHTFIDSKNESLKHLKERYKFAKDLNETVKMRIVEYSDINQCHEQIFMQGITFKKSINILLEAEAAIFNSANNSSIEKIRLVPQKNIDFLLQKLDTHINAVSDIRTHLNFYFEEDNKSLLE